MNNIFLKLFILFFYILLSACAVKSLKTTGPINGGVPIEQISIKFDGTLPNQIRIEKYARGIQPTITEDDKRKAFQRAWQLSLLFSTEFNGAFKNYAKPYGLTVVPPDEKVSSLKVSITALRLVCSQLGCMSLLTLKGDIPAFGNRANQWEFTSEAGQAIIESPMDKELFKTFANELLDAMAKDGFLEKH